VFCSFFASAKNEPRNRLRGFTPKNPKLSRATHKKCYRIFCSNARGCRREKTLLSPPQRGRRKYKDFYRKNINPVGESSPLPPRNSKLIYSPHRWGRGPNRKSGPFGQNRTAQNPASPFDIKFFEGSARGTFFQKSSPRHIFLLSFLTVQRPR
jgi:hypothetical protein